MLTGWAFDWEREGGGEGVEMETIPLIEKVKLKFQRADAVLEYRAEEFRFGWSPSDPKLTKECGVYCLLSHGETRVQKVGKGDGETGLNGRLRGYTNKKTEQKANSDPTDRLWRTVMMEKEKLLGQPLSFYYFVTEPKKIILPIDYGDEIQEELKCHWARDFERSLSERFRKEYEAAGVLNVTHFLLAGAGD
jgi:hypothetical protein